jgi:hypothetical protein
MRNEAAMATITQAEYQGFNIAITEEGGRFTPRISHAGRMIEHDGRASEIWAATSCGSMERALQRAQAAIDTGRVK